MEHGGKPMKMKVKFVDDPVPKASASDAMSLPLYITNSVFFTLFFSVVYFLLTSWREKIRTNTPLHIIDLSEIVAILALVASFIYLLGFFGIDFVQSLFLQPSSDIWAADDDEEDIILKEDARKVPCGQALDCSIPKIAPIASPKVTQKVSYEKPAIEIPPPTAEDEEIIKAVVAGTIPSYSLESKLGDCKRAASIRREALQRVTGKSLEGLPLEGFDYESILGQCCEMPVGYITIPVGIAGPLMLDGKEFSVPMATTEGCLVASTNRGCKAINLSGGATSVLLKDGMTRAPVVRFNSAKRAAELKFFMEDPANYETISMVFNKSSRFGRLQTVKCAVAGKNLYMRFCCSTGDAMGMNMVSKGVQNVLDFLQNDFPDMDVIGISGNYCSDKKPAAVNWIEGRGKSVVCEALIPLRLLNSSKCDSQSPTNSTRQSPKQLDLAGIFPETGEICRIRRVLRSTSKLQFSAPIPSRELLRNSIRTQRFKNHSKIRPVALDIPIDSSGFDFNRCSLPVSTARSAAVQGHFGELQEVESNSCMKFGED